MGIRVSWSIYEQVFLLGMFQKILIGQLDRKQAIKDISVALRELAIRGGIEIDSKYRNENGIAMQMSKLEYVYTGKKSGFPTESGWYYDVVDLYRNNSDKYNKILQETLQKISLNGIEKVKILSDSNNECEPFREMVGNDNSIEEMEEKCSAVLNEYFPDGLQLRGIHLDKFRLHFFQKYEKELKLEDDELLKKLRVIGVLRENRLYAKKPQIQEDIMGRMIEDMENVFDSGAHCIYVERLLERYRQELASKLCIYNEKALVDLLKTNNENNYSYIYGYIKRTNSDADYKEDVLAVLKKHYKPMTYDEMQQELWYIPLDNIKYALRAEPTLVNVEKETYYYAPNFPISEEELHLLQNIIQKEIEDADFLSGDIRGRPLPPSTLM